MKAGQILSALLLLAAAVLAPLLLPTQGASAVDPIHQYKFHNHEDLTYDLYQWQEEYPHLMELSTIGTSYLGHELWNIHLTNYAKNRYQELPEIYLDGGHHGNEYCGSEITILTLQYLLENYGSDPDATFILDNAHVYITPMINPDGIDMDTRFNSRHVDLNRNYPYEWVAADSPWGSHGSGPASEIEVSSNIAFMEKHEFDLVLTGHTGIVLLIYPWGYTRDPSPDDAMYKSIEKDVEERWDIPAGQSAVELYVARGTGKDYGYAVNHAPTWTFEVDDQQFVPVSGEAISQRLQPIFECYMFLMMEAISGKWWPNLSIVDEKVMGHANEDDFTVQFTVNNSGYTDVVNGTATLEIHRGPGVSKSRSVSTLFSVGQFNESLINITMPGDYDGDYDYTLTLDYTRMVVAGSRPMRSRFEGSLYVKPEPSFLSAFAAMDSIMKVLCALVVSRVRKRRR